MRRASDVVWLTVEDVANQLQVNTETVRRWIRSSKLEVLQIGGARGGYRIHPDALDRFVAERYGKVAEAETGE